MSPRWGLGTLLVVISSKLLRISFFEGLPEPS